MGSKQNTFKWLKLFATNSQKTGKNLWRKNLIEKTNNEKMNERKNVKKFELPIVTKSIERRKLGRQIWPKLSTIENKRAEQT